MPRTFRQRVEALTQYEPNTGCLLWLGATSGSRGRYGHLKLCSRNVKVHRAVWEEAYGPVPDGMEVDHKCNQTLCVELTHLQLLTPWQNKAKSNGITAQRMRAKGPPCA
jgi:hypothetical protein